MIKNDYEVRAKKFINEFAPYLKGIRITKSNSHAITKVKFYYIVRSNKNNARNTRINFNIALLIDIKAANCLTNSWAGNSKTEMLGYQQAQKDGFEYLLAKISLYKYRNRSFFIMPRAKVATTLAWKSQERLWYKLTEDERRYLRDNFEDLHRNNWGSLNGKLVLIDYAWNDFKKYLL